MKGEKNLIGLGFDVPLMNNRHCGLILHITYQVEKKTKSGNLNK